MPIKYPDVFEVLEEILGAGGIPVLAHPYLYDSIDLMSELVEKGLAGIEVWTPTVSDEQIKTLQTFAKKNKLLALGGSDFHGEFSERHGKLGDIIVPETNVNDLLGYKAKVKRAKKRAEKAAAMEKAE